MVAENNRLRHRNRVDRDSKNVALEIGADCSRFHFHTLICSDSRRNDCLDCNDHHNDRDRLRNYLVGIYCLDAMAAAVVAVTLIDLKSHFRLILAIESISSVIFNVKNVCTEWWRTHFAGWKRN